MGEDEKEPGPDFSLGGNLEEALHKSHLPLNVAFAYSLNLPFSHHMHRLITLDCSTCRSKTEEPESSIDAPFDEPMVLLDEVVEMLTLSQLSAVVEDSFFLQFLDLRRIGRILIDVDHSATEPEVKSPGPLFRALDQLDRGGRSELEECIFQRSKKRCVRLMSQPVNRIV